MKLKYGMNPHQDYAELADNKSLEFVNGSPSVINILDALNAWQLVRELDAATGMAAATSFKHVTPSGSAVGTDVTKGELLSYNMQGEVSSALGRAYLKARGSDRLASFGDFIGLSRPVDVETAMIIKTEVSDGIIAPGFEPEALEVLKAKKGGKYVIFKIDPDYSPDPVEERTVFGMTLRQKRNDLVVDESLLGNVVTERRDVPPEVKRNLLVGMITLKYTQSNSIDVVSNGHAIGIGSGQQSRILCTELALSKANRWYQKTRLDFSKVEFPDGGRIKKTDKDQFLEQTRKDLYGDTLSLSDLPDLCLCSDGFFPQTDNIEAAHRNGVRTIASPMGSIRDGDIIERCNELGIVFVNTGVRLFHH
jgi:AICAR transformylase/IMP cyclohydrolase PurH